MSKLVEYGYRLRDIEVKQGNTEPDPIGIQIPEVYIEKIPNTVNNYQSIQQGH